MARSGAYSLTTPDDRTTVVCLHCDKPMEISRKAISITCKHCHKPLQLEDVRYKDYTSRREIYTCGVITVEHKSQVVVTGRIKCGGLVVRGKVKGQIHSRGPVLIGPDAEVKGDVTAPTLAVGAGAVLDGRYAIGPGSAAGADVATASNQSAAPPPAQPA
jgi:hypothetical protein